MLQEIVSDMEGKHCEAGASKVILIEMIFCTCRDIFSQPWSMNIESLLLAMTFVDGDKSPASSLRSR